MFTKYLGPCLGFAVLAAPPAAAAQDFRTNGVSNARPSALAGFTVRMPLGQRKDQKPVARLQLTTYLPSSSQPVRIRSYNPDGVELGMSRAGKPLLFSGGQNLAEIKQQMGLNKTTTLIIVGGVILIAVAIAAATATAQSDLLNPCSGGDLDCR